ncbi:MAG: hypothetical protein HYU66_21880, partial [Armatimonadetes bacterium]|nr:hypothetical protein [Armatimonadota bacterium]
DCHTPHAILKVDDPRSSVARANLPKTCARCHSNKVLMDSFGLPSFQYDKFVTSVHGKSLLQGGSEGAPNCASCHGSHGAAPPQVQSLQHVCAQCHPNTAEQFLGGEHHQAVAQHKMTACVTCHDPHAAPHPTDELLHSSCQQCHKTGDPAAATAEEIYKTLQDARAQFDEVTKTAKDDTLGLLPEKEMKSRLDEANTALMQAAVAQHSAKLRDVERFTQVVTGFHGDLADARKSYQERIALRRFALVYIWGFLLVSIFSIAVQRRRSERARVMQAGNHGGSGL